MVLGHESARQRLKRLVGTAPAARADGHKKTLAPRRPIGYRSGVRRTKSPNKKGAAVTTGHVSADALYDFLQAATPTSTDLQTAAHLVACPKCARAARRLERAQVGVEHWIAQTARRARALRAGRQARGRSSRKD